MQTTDPKKIREALTGRRAHDFYVGRGPDAKYLGTASVCTDVGALADQLLSPYRPWREGGIERPFTEEVWERHVTNLLDSVHEVDASAVTITWPHPYPNSLDSDYSWWFEKGGLYLYNLGALVEIRYPNGGIKSKLRFPDFTPASNDSKEQTQ
jgi:hypothetical protein